MTHLPKHHTYRNLLVAFLAIMAVGLTMVAIGMTALYHDVHRCGFRALHCPNPDAKTNVVIAGGYVFVVGFYALLILAIVYVVQHARHHEHHQPPAKPKKG